MLCSRRIFCVCVRFQGNCIVSSLCSKPIHIQTYLGTGVATVFLSRHKNQGRGISDSTPWLKESSVFPDETHRSPSSFPSQKQAAVVRAHWEIWEAGDPPHLDVPMITWPENGGDSVFPVNCSRQGMLRSLNRASFSVCSLLRPQKVGVGPGAALGGSLKEVGLHCSVMLADWVISAGKLEWREGMEWQGAELCPVPCKWQLAAAFHSISARAGRAYGPARYLLPLPWQSGNEMNRLCTSYKDFLFVSVLKMEIENQKKWQFGNCLGLLPNGYWKVCLDYLTNRVAPWYDGILIFYVITNSYWS